MKFMQMCIKNGFFTCGSNEQYRVVINYYNNLCGLSCIQRYHIDMLVCMIYLCSDIDKFPPCVIYTAVCELFADKKIVD